MTQLLTRSRIWAAGAFLAALTATAHAGWAPDWTPDWTMDQLTARDAVQVSAPSTQMEWLFNMGLVSGTNQRGEVRHFAVIVNTLLAPQLKKLGPIPYPDFKITPLVLITLQDLDRKQITMEQVRAEHLDRATFGVESENGSVSLSRTDSASGVVSRLLIDTGKTGISVQIVSTKPQALFGDRGWADNGPLGKALYLSRTGRTLDPAYASSLRFQGETVRLTEGQFWEDHQVVGSLHLDIINLKWNWFAFHFADHSEAMIYRIEDKRTGKLYSEFAERVRPDGSIEKLGSVQVTEARHEISRGFRVPTAWDLVIPGKAELHLEHVIHSPWYDVILGQMHDSAIEGACEVTGTTPWGEVTLAWGEYTNSDFFGLGVLPQLD